ncbi:N-formylglutamate amidohydrolase [Novosphingobium sp. FSW06-99]|uniref:N-formylglutamate amidohydrolase n=1 Tax=Novosphingobium sp. FSW06-99 TaxID=1739113 RepID=UPI00076C77A6|nr:N-formylglutamate amidohydrolase [Novosphingobium sp. FSW06-99]KUR80584.1 N-formylglutamate amidohydrolase [Novosphingobium sp. FSW06-99]
MSEAFRLIGDTAPGGILIESDHASARVPDDIDLGIDPALLNEHIAIDIGVAAIAELLVQRPGYAAFLGNVSRLVCDFNRDEHGPAVAPIASDGHAIPGNALDHAGHEARLARFYRPYHAAFADVIDRMRPALILSLHSFTPRLASRPEEARPWHIGVLYNRDRRGAALALDWLAREPGLVVGDQQPYSGELLNATMDRHAEARGQLYVGVELRQDLVGHATGQREWADRLERLTRHVVASAA